MSFLSNTHGSPLTTIVTSPASCSIVITSASAVPSTSTVPDGKRVAEPASRTRSSSASLDAFRLKAANRRERVSPPQSAATNESLNDSHLR